MSHEAPPPDPLPSWSRAVLRRLAPLRRLIEHMLDEEGDLLARWRARLTAVFLTAAATLGLLPAVTTILSAAGSGHLPLAALDAVLMGFVYWLLLSSRPSNRTRNRFLAGASFSIGVVALVTLGPFSTALSWLLLSTFLAAFLLGPRTTIVVVVTITVLLVGIAVGIRADAFPWVAEFPGAAERWMLTAVDFFFLVVIFAGVNSLILRLLEREDHARVRAERRLAEGRRHEALGTLAGGIAHDFNNLLVPMLANVEAVRDALPPESREQQALRDAHRSAERARDLVQRILAFGRGVDAARGRLDPCAVARDVVELCRLSIPARVHLVLECEGTPAVHASVAELHQVLHNLITNAVHAVNGQGTVRVEVRPRGRHAAEGVQLRVSDTGMGMSRETRERIFDPYFSTRGPERGTGLGLPIVRSIVASLAGEILVQSEVGVGSTFTVLLPAAPAHVSPPRDLPTPVRGSDTVTVPEGTRLLLVDDEDGVRRATARMLESIGCTVAGASDAADALARLDVRARGVDVVLTDHRMPGLSGIELIERLRARGDDVPAVLMSGHIEAALDSGALPERVVLLQKPFTRAELTTAVLDALRGETVPRTPSRR